MTKATSRSLLRFMVSITLCLLVVFSLTGLTGCVPSVSFAPKEGKSDLPVEQYYFDPLDEPDRLGPWNQTYQFFEREADWKQIVFDSHFQLGEMKVVGSFETAYNVRENLYEMSFGSYPNIGGSSFAVAMVIEFARQHLGFTDKNANEFVVSTSSHYAYINLILRGSNTASFVFSENIAMDGYHPIDLIIADEPFDAELRMAEGQGVALVTKPVCYDAFVFITYKDNPVDSLTLDQIRDIYSGKITNWKEVGGEDIPIVAYQREKDSDCQRAMINLVMKDTPMIPPESFRAISNAGYEADIVTEFRPDKASIGYAYRYHIDNLYKGENIKILKINGVSPDEVNLKSGLYPITALYYGIIRGGEENSPGGKFLDWMISKEGQQCIRQAGYIPYYYY